MVDLLLPLYLAQSVEMLLPSLLSFAPCEEKEARSNRGGATGVFDPAQLYLNRLV